MFCILLFWLWGLGCGYWHLELQPGSSSIGEYTVGVVAYEYCHLLPPSTQTGVSRTNSHPPCSLRLADGMYCRISLFVDGHCCKNELTLCTRYTGAVISSPVGPMTKVHTVAFLQILHHPGQLYLAVQTTQVVLIVCFKAAAPSCSA
jgi:hypothetical protein